MRRTVSSSQPGIRKHARTLANAIVSDDVIPLSQYKENHRAQADVPIDHAVMPFSGKSAAVVDIPPLPKPNHAVRPFGGKSAAVVDIPPFLKPKPPLRKKKSHASALRRRDPRKDLLAERP